MDESLLSIGELASICNVTPKTLRHYDRLGLLKPAKINQQNGYRYYEKAHITRVIAIKQLQEIGVSLEQIGRFYDAFWTSDIVDGLNGILMYQEKEISLKLEEYKRKLDRIRLMQLQCTQLQEQLLDIKADSLIVKDLPDRNLIYKEYAGTYSSDIFRDNYRTIWDLIAAFEPEIRNVCSPPLAVFQSCMWVENIAIQIGYLVNTELHLPGIENRVIKAGKYACDIYYGPHGAMKKEFYGDFYERIRKSDYIMTGSPIEIYHISEVHTVNNNRYCTEIQIPIE